MGDRWSCWDSWSLVGLQLYSVLALSAMAGLLLVTGQMLLLVTCVAGEARAAAEASSSNSTSPAHLPAMALACHVVLRMRSRLTLWKERENFQNPSSLCEVLLCCSIAIGLAICWCQKRWLPLIIRQWTSSARGQQTVLVFKVGFEQSYWTERQTTPTVNCKWPGQYMYSKLFLTARDSSRETSLPQRRHYLVSSASTHITVLDGVIRLSAGTSSTRIAPGMCIWTEWWVRGQRVSEWGVKVNIHKSVGSKYENRCATSKMNTCLHWLVYTRYHQPQYV